MSAEARPWWDRRAARLVLLATWWGSLVGFAEASLLLVASAVLHRFTHLGPHLAWMAPVLYITVFLAVGAVLSLPLARARDATWLRVEVWAFATLGGIGLGMNLVSLQAMAVVVLAAGVATQCAALAARHEAAFLRLVRRTAPALAAAVVLAALLPAGWHAVRERRITAALPAAPGRPNVLVIFLDTVRSWNLSTYGYARETSPALTRLAARGTLFVHAVAPASWTLPSHASAFTGLWANELSTDWDAPLPRSPRTLAEALAARGWRTAGFVANTHYLARESGMDRGFAHYEDFVASPGQILMSSAFARRLAYNPRFRRWIGSFEIPGRRTGADIVRHFLDWLPADTTRPFFAFLNLYDAHEPYLPPSPYRERWGAPSPDRQPMIWPGRRMTPAQVADEIAQYDGAIAYMDDQLAALFDSLAARGVLERTLVIVTSDHGEEFGEHGLFTHGYSLYPASLEVPLVMALPGVVPAGLRVDGRVSLRDLAATVMALASPGGETLPGSPMLPLRPGARSDTAYAEVRYTRGLPPGIPVHDGDVRGVLTTRHEYVRYARGNEELFALDRDPGAHHDLAADSASAGLLGDLRTALRRFPSFRDSR